MFVNAFATLFALCTLIYNAPSGTYDSLVAYKFVDEERSIGGAVKDVQDFGTFDSTFYGDFSASSYSSWYLGDGRENNLPVYYLERYYIYDNFDGGGSHSIGYLDFYFTFSQESSAYAYLNVRSHLDDTYNLYANVNFTISSTNGSVPVVQFHEVFDFSVPNYIDYTWKSDTESQLFTALTLASSGNYCNFSITFIPMDYDTYLGNPTNGYQSGYDDGYQEGYNDGYADGLDLQLNTSGEAFVIFNGILQIAMVPVNFFLAIFNFDVFGINISGLVSALLTVAITIIIIRFIAGKSQGGKD